MVDFRFYLITDRTQCIGKSLGDTLEQACRAGVKAVQLREKDLSPIELYALAKEIKSKLDKHNCRLLINDRVDIACSIGADGVHLTEKSLPPYEARKCFTTMAATTPLIGVSTHSLDGVLKAEAEGSDFALLGPIFYTPSKSRYGLPLGLKSLEIASQKARLPIFAIGGITAERTKDCIKAGAHGVAAISAIMSAQDAFRAVKDFETALGSL
jgi:thiamine-phosphate pyrophosphorylase